MANSDFKLTIEFKDDFGSRRPRAIIHPEPWPLGHVFNDLVDWNDTQLIDEFICDLDAEASAETQWFDDLIVVEFDWPDIVRVVDIDYESQYTTVISRANLRSLMLEWREAVSHRNRGIK